MLDVLLTFACVVLLVMLLYAAHVVSIKERPFYYVAVNLLNLLIGAVALSPWGLFELPPTGWPASLLVISMAGVVIIRWRSLSRWILWHLGCHGGPRIEAHPLRRSTDWGSLSPAPTPTRGRE